MKLPLFLIFIFWISPLFATQSIESIRAFSLKKNALETISLKNAGRDTVVVFLSKDCPCSKGNLGYINQLANQYKNIRFIGIHSKKMSSNADVSQYFQDQNVQFEIYNDPELLVANEFRALKTPHAFIVSKAGEILYNGGITNTTTPSNAKEYYLKDALANLEAHIPLSKTETRTLGCFIVR